MMTNPVSRIRALPFPFDDFRIRCYSRVRGWLGRMGGPFSARRLKCDTADVTTEVRNREQVEACEFFDSLTDLPNRAWLNERLPVALAYAELGERQLGLLTLDLDSFKAVNDVLGLACGEQLLREVSTRLSRSKRGDDTVLRLGGGKFAILAPVDDDDFELEAVARKILAALADPVVIGCNEVFMTASIGISRYPRDGDDATRLVRYAGSAMYAARRAGGNQFCFHDSAKSPTAPATLRRSGLSGLPAACID
jgi:diguanylate cyclase (GGDEF)-like protein